MDEDQWEREHTYTRVGGGIVMYSWIAISKHLH